MSDLEFERYKELSRKEEEGTITPEEQSDLDFYLREAEWELQDDIKYQW